MRIVNSIADRMISRMAGKLTAQAACCDPQYVTVSCGCTNGYLYEQTCFFNCCETICGTCSDTGRTC
jgi:hypothetical protein